jgi:catechol 2,3-dioxygenase-like lactoylglutathione lyase family enzyme
MVRHLAGIAEVVDDMDAAVRFYRNVMGLPVQRDPDAPYAVASVRGVLHFGIWSRAHAAEVVFKDARAIDRVPLGFTVGFETDSVDTAAEALRTQWTLSQAPQTEPWGQRTSRFMSPSGALCEFSETPGARRLVNDVGGSS